MSGRLDASSPFPWPPVIFATALALSLMLTAIWPLVIASGSARSLLRIGGIGVIVLGGGLAIAAETGFLRAGTATLPTRPTRVIVTAGIYRFTRNPMYLGFCMILAGAGMVASSWWFVLILPFAFIAVTKLAISREERYLEHKFGAEYLSYKARTRRWL